MAASDSNVRPLRPVTPAETGLALRYYTVTSADGTRLRAWTNDVEGPTVLLCNGLGTNPYAWPGLLDPDCGVHVISWNHRGVGGSDRPSNLEHVGIDAITEDAVAVMDDAGVEACPMIGWSIGVNTMFELAIREPDRVTGLLAVGGVPGDTFGTMLAPLFVPRFARKPIAVSLARLFKRLSGPMDLVKGHLDVGPGLTRLLSHSGFMLPVADLELARRAVNEFMLTPVDWYMHLALHSSLHERVSLRTIDVPTTFIGGTYDILTSCQDMASAAERIPGAEYVELRASHFLPMEQPEVIHSALLELLARVRARGPIERD